MAMPASPMSFNEKQPDGSLIELYVRGETNTTTGWQMSKATPSSAKTTGSNTLSLVSTAI
jgi:hypothetical protein